MTNMVAYPEGVVVSAGPLAVVGQVAILVDVEPVLPGAQAQQHSRDPDR